MIGYGERAYRIDNCSHPPPAHIACPCATWQSISLDPHAGVLYIGKQDTSIQASVDSEWG